MKEKMNKYHAWKAKPNCEPIEGTDRNFIAPSQKFVASLLAHEEGVQISVNWRVILADGSFWHISYFSKA